jgi:diaminopimelate decarboxylase
MDDHLKSAPPFAPVPSPATGERCERFTGGGLHFHHPPATRQFWRDLVQPLVGRQPTPFYLFSQPPIEAALAEWDAHFDQLPVRHWLSCKTQPLPPLLQWWRAQERGIEVVSEFELQAALHEGFPPERILLNGPAKHHWLPRHAMRALCVNFDSLAEVRALATLARPLEWTVGLRLNTPEEVDPEHPENPTQFGLTGPEICAAMDALKREGVRPQIAHFHLRTNVASAAVYARALAQAAEMCRAAGFAPEILGCGGGFPSPHVLTRGGKRLDAHFQLRDMTPVYEQAQRLFPGLREIWLENGRWLTARSGVLVVQVLDVKERRGLRNLICDGGRATHALVSTWEQHELLPLPGRAGPWVPTTVNGPTCMAFDQIARRPLPADVQAGDHLVWLDAGAYHLPWETRFSHGLAAVLWHDGHKVSVAREREDFAGWWGRWR